MHLKKDTEVRLKAGPNTKVIEDRQGFHAEGPEVQNMAPPTTEHYSHPPPTRTEGSRETAAMLDCICQLQLTLKEHVLLNSKQAEYQISQNADLFLEMKKEQTRRDLDPAVMAIPTFTGEESEKCLDWINRIKNVCSQAGCSLRQELMNKSEPVVWNFIRTMGDTWTDEDVVDEILKYFLDIPTPAHAITKLRTLIQGEEEAIVTDNQKYRTLVERVEGKPVEKIDSYVELEQYLGSISLPIRKVLMGCSKFTMGYLDDIIIFSNNELEHLQHIEEIFKRLEHFGLKMKREKCDFFKKHIQYLGHLIAEEGFTPFPEKLESIYKMPRPKTPKEVKQFLGLMRYYRKFIHRFSDIVRSLTNLTRHDADFNWTEKCDKAFNHLKELLMEHPALRYPDPDCGYTLFTDTSGIGLAGVLTQEFKDKRGKKKHHPISYVSGQFRGSQQNWVSLTKEAYTIYMAIRKLSFYITDAEVTIKCDHLPLKKFLQKQMLNAKVNNWAVELEQFNLKVEWIQGVKNTLADSLSRLLEADPEAKLQPKKEGHKFGTFCFEELNETSEISLNFWTPATDLIEHIEITYDEENVKE